MGSLLLIGGGGHCHTVIDSLQGSKYDKIGIVDKLNRVGEVLNGIPFVGSDDDLESLRVSYCNAHVSLGSIGDYTKRRDLAHKLQELQFDLALIIHPKATLGLHTTIANGVLVGPSCIINSGTEIGEMCILNSGCIVEHNCMIKAYAHIAPGAVVCGDVHVGTGTHLGAGCVVREGISIGDNVMIGAGSIVTSDIPDGVVAYGNPCRVIRKTGETQ